MNLFEIVRNLCSRKNISIAALERECGFGNATIKKWGNTIPSGDRLAKVADYFQVSVDYLLSRESFSCFPDEKTYQIALKLTENEDLRALFDAAVKASPKHLKAYASFLNALQDKNEEI